MYKENNYRILTVNACYICLPGILLFWFSCTKTPPNVNSASYKPHIDSIHPNQGEQGTQVTILGGIFSLITEENKVFFNHKAATVLSGSDSTLIVIVPEGTGTGPITVQVQGRPGVDSVLFTYVIPAPSVTSLSPATGAVGTEVTITGKNFSPTASKNLVKFNGVQANVTTASATQLKVSVPDKATSGSVTVTTNGKTSNENAFDVCYGITNYSSTCGVWNETISINGCLGNNIAKVIFLDKYAVTTSSIKVNQYIQVKVPQTTSFSDVGQPYPIRIVDNNGKKISGPNFTIIRPFQVVSATAQSAIGTVPSYNLTINGSFTSYSDHYQLVSVYVNGTELTGRENNLLVNETNIQASLPASLINPDATNKVKVMIVCKSQTVNIKLE